jgi:hypothetical protein
MKIKLALLTLIAVSLFTVFGCVSDVNVDAKDDGCACGESCKCATVKPVK